MTAFGGTAGALGAGGAGAAWSEISAVAVSTAGAGVAVKAGGIAAAGTLGVAGALGALGALGAPGTAAAAGAGCAGLLGAGGGVGMGGLNAAGGAVLVATALLAGALKGAIVAFATTVPGGVPFVAVCPIGGRKGNEGEVLPPNPRGGVNGARNGSPIWGFTAGMETGAASCSEAGFALSRAGSAVAGGVIMGAGTSAREGITVCKIELVTFTGALSTTACSDFSEKLSECDSLRDSWGGVAC